MWRQRFAKGVMIQRLRTTGLDELSKVAIMELNLPTSISIVYELIKCLNVINPMQFLGDKKLIHKAMDIVTV